MMSERVKPTKDEVHERTCSDTAAKRSTRELPSGDTKKQPTQRETENVDQEGGGGAKANVKAGQQVQKDARSFLVERNVAPLLNMLVEDILAERPDDVAQFLVTWSQSRCHHSSTSSHRQDAASQTVDNSDGMIDEEHAIKKNSDAADDEGELAETHDDRENDEVWEEEEENGEDFSCPTEGELRDRFPWPGEAEGLKIDEERHIGRGNYGHVVLGYINTKDDELDGQRLAQLSTDNEGLHRVRIAVKKVAVTKYWHLDEAEHLDDITLAVNAAAAETQRVLPLKQGEDRITYRRRVQSEPFSDLSRGEVEEEEGKVVIDLHLSLAGHWNVVKLVRSCFFDEVTHSIVFPMTYVPYPLDAIVAKRRELKKRSGGAGIALFSEDEVRYVARQVVLALVFLTERCGKCHLDLKPANILVDFIQPSIDETNGKDGTKEEGGGGSDENWAQRSLVGARVALCDFGLAQNIGSKLFQLGDFFYMSPEVFFEGHGIGADAEESSSRKYAEKTEGYDDYENDEDDDDGDVDSAVTESDRRELTHFCSTHDVWSLGCCLLFMLDGICAFSWKERDYFDAMRKNYVAPMPKHATDHSPMLLAFIAACFERDWKRRPTPLQLARHPFLVQKFP